MIADVRLELTGGWHNWGLCHKFQDVTVFLSQSEAKQSVYLAKFVTHQPLDNWFGILNEQQQERKKQDFLPNIKCCHPKINSNIQWFIFFFYFPSKETWKGFVKFNFNAYIVGSLRILFLTML